MKDLTVVLAPDRIRTRILVKSPHHEVLRAALPSVQSPDNPGIPRFLEGLSMWTEQRLFVVLVADEQSNSSCGATYEALADGRSFYYEVGVAVRPRRRRTPSASAPGRVSFRDLHGFGRYER